MRQWIVFILTLIFAPVLFVLGFNPAMIPPKSRVGQSDKTDQ
jgi:p-aminobenzoyl-glutamate transporter AbgT